MHLFDILNFGVALFVMGNAFGTLPIFMSYTADASPRVQRILALLVTFTVFICFVAIMLFGEVFLALFSISIPAFRIAGGLILLRVGFSMLSGELDTGAPPDEKFTTGSLNPMSEAAMRFSKMLIPVVIPSIVGPGVISLLIVFAHRSTSHVGIEIELFLAIAVVCVLIGLILLAGDRLQRMFGNTGLAILTQIFALITLAVAVQFILAGMSDVTINFINPEALSVHEHVTGGQ